jgi:hydrogenase maturation protease
VTQLSNNHADSHDAPRTPDLVLGLGNILLRDEGVGVRVLDVLRDMRLPVDVELMDGATAGLDLLDAVADRRKVVVIDAIDSDAAPGTVIRLEAPDLAPPQVPGASLHEIGFQELLGVTRQLGVTPQEVVIIGVVPFEVSAGLDLSEPMSRLVPQIAALVTRELASVPAA